MEFDIQIIKDELRTDSRLLSQFLDHRHRTILENIDKYHMQLSTLSSITFETEMSKIREDGWSRGKPTRYALLTEDQCYFILTLMRNNEKVVNAKLALVKAFRDARKLKTNRDIERLSGKKTRASECQAIKDLVDYAMAKGSKNADKYYMLITKMTNEILGISGGNRDILPSNVLKQLNIIENTIELSIRDGLDAEMEYKDIYKLASYRAKLITEQLNKNILTK